LIDSKIIYEKKIHNDAYFIIIEAKGERDYPRYIKDKDKKFLMGIVFTYPFDIQKEMLRLVLENIVKPSEREKWISYFEELLREVSPKKITPKLHKMM